MMPGLVATLLILPAVELYLIVTVSHYIGLTSTVALLLAAAVAGGILVKREGRRAWQALREALAAGTVPGRREVADSALLLAGGALLVVPGFLTDLVGLALILPPTRPAARRAVLRLSDRRRSRPPRPPGAGRVIDVPTEPREPR